MRSFVLNTILVGSSILFSLALLEVGVRLYVKLTQSKSIASLQLERPLPAPDHACSLSEIIQVRNSTVIPYELRSDLHTRFLDVPLRTNRFGFRSQEISEQKEGDAIRILGIGDSVMFGWGVPVEKNYLSIAASVLKRSFTACDFEIVNTAVPGYNGIIEAATLREQGVAFHPDVVVLGVVQNDMDLPNFIQVRENFLSLEYSFLQRMLTDRLSSISLASAPLKSDGDGFVRDKRKVPPEFRYLAGRKNYVRAIEEIRQLTAARDIPLLVFSHAFLDRRFRKVFTQLGIEALEAGAAWQDFAKSAGIDPVAAAMLKPGVDPHPSELLHQVAGETLAAALAVQLQTRLACFDGDTALTSDGSNRAGSSPEV